MKKRLEFVECLLCGVSTKTLKYHLRSKHKTSPQEYYNFVNNITNCKCDYCNTNDKIFDEVHGIHKCFYRDYCKECVGLTIDTNSELVNNSRSVEDDEFILDQVKSYLSNIELNEKLNHRNYEYTPKEYISSDFFEKQSNNTQKLNDRLKAQLSQFEGHLEFEYRIHLLLNELGIKHLSGNTKLVLSPKVHDSTYSSRSRFYLDIYIPELKLCIECDGSFHSNEYDSKRDEFLKLHRNITTLRLKNEIIDSLNKSHLQYIVDLYRKIPVELLESPKAELTTK